MCGIAGIIAAAGQRVNFNDLRPMMCALAHRGPDGEGVWITSDERVGLAHRRLAIIDLDSRANQPMASWDRQLTIVYNGEIYNHSALRRELVANGHRFTTISSDTEVLIEGYRAWGLAGLLERIDGIFCFALHDAKSDTTHLVRDRYGIKPLYVSWLDVGEKVPQFLFASELRGIAAHPKFCPRPNWRQVANYLTFMSVPAPATMLDGVWKVPAGCRLAVDAGGQACLERYQHVGRPRGGAERATASSRSAIVANIRETFAEVVAAQMVADVPVGVMLSGGLDSGAILAEASRRHSSLDAYTLAFTDDPESDETALAAETARRCGARHRIFRLTPEDAIASVDEVIIAMDEPQADWVCAPLWFLSREVARRGGKVMLVGEGADEQFVGYEHWRLYLGPIARLAAVARVAGPIAKLAAAGLSMTAVTSVSLRTRADFLDRAVRSGELFWGGAVLCFPLVRQAIWPGGSAGNHDTPRWVVSAGEAGSRPQDDPMECVAGWYREVDSERPGADPVTRMIGIEFLQRLPELLLMRVDKMTMAHGVEARVPFLARSIVELGFEISGAEKLAGGQTKALLREAFADLLPSSVLAARKRGFGAPVDRWLRGPFGAQVRDEIVHGPLATGLALRAVDQLCKEHQSGRANHAGMLWALFVLSRWLSSVVPSERVRTVA